MPYTKRKAHYGTMDNLINYITNPDKTDGGLLISSLNCNVATASQEFKNNTYHWKNRGNRVGYHLIQSFHPDDPITPEQANAIGKQLCEELYPNFQCLVCTHIDRGHIHNQIAINAVNLKGRKLEDRLANEKEGIGGYKIVSDRLAKEYGCFVLPEQKITFHKNKDYYYEYKAQTWKTTIASDIDRIKGDCSDIDELFQKLISLGYDIKYGKHISIKAVGMKKYARFYKLGEGYDIKDLKEYFGEKEIPDEKLNLSDIQVTVTNFNEIRVAKIKESRAAILITSKVAQGGKYSEYQKTKYNELKRFYQLRDELDMLKDNNINSYEDLTIKIEGLRNQIRAKNSILFKIKNENKNIIQRAEKAQDFIRLYKVNDYANYYKSIDKDYKIPSEAEVFLKIKQELGITNIEEAHEVINEARNIRLEINEKSMEIVELQREMNKFDIIKEEQLIKSDLFIHNVKFGANRIDYENSTDSHWCVKLPYSDDYMFIEKSQVTFNNKNQYYTLFLVDDKSYDIYTEDEVQKNWGKKPQDKEELSPSYSLSGTNIEDYVSNKKAEYAAQYSNEKEKDDEE